MTKTWGIIMEESAHSGIVRDVNGQRLGQWILVDWQNKHAIIEFAHIHEVEIEYSQIKDGPEGLTIDGMDAEDWMNAVLAD